MPSNCPQDNDTIRTLVDRRQPRNEGLIACDFGQVRCLKKFVIRHSKNSFEHSPSRSLIGTSHVTDGWKLSFILVKRISTLLIGIHHLLDFDLGIVVRWALDRRNLRAGSVPRVTDTIRITDIGNFLIDQGGHFPR